MWQPIVEVLGKLFVVGLSLAESVGQRDAYIEAVDGALALGRAKNDRDLEAKYGR